MLSMPFVIGQNFETRNKKFGILGGVNLQNLNGKDNNGDKLTNDMIIGYHFGVNVQIPLVPEFYLQPGLLFSTKGAENSYGSLTGKYNLSYIELPLNFVYKGLLGNGHVMLGFGPYAGYAIGGKSTIDYDNSTIDQDIVFVKEVEEGDDYLIPYVKRFDAGGNIFAGYEFAGGLFFQVNAQFGMLKINPVDNRSITVYSDELAVYNRGFGLSLGYRF